MLGFAWCWSETSQRLAERLDPALEGRTVEVRGAVASVPQRLEGGLRFRLATEPSPGIPSLVELTWYDTMVAPRAGERLVLVVRLRRPRGFANPGGTDQEARMLREGIGATGYVKSAASAGRAWQDIARQSRARGPRRNRRRDPRLAR